MPTQFSHSEGKHIAFFKYRSKKSELYHEDRFDFFNICLQEIMYEAIALEFVKIKLDINQIIDVHYCLLTD